MEIKMDKETISFIVFLISIVTKYGAPAVKNFIDYIEKDEITKEDIEALIIDKDPEEFFE